MKGIIIKLFCFLKIPKIVLVLNNLLDECYVYELKKKNVEINFFEQGMGGLRIAGNIAKFSIHPTSHLKSNTFIECSGGVSIGRYFHAGRSLTIFSSNHNYESEVSIPYDSSDVLKPVIINDFVWCGSNVTIVPGVNIGKGAVIGSGAVITKNVPDYAVMGGNPAKVIKYRDKLLFEKLETEGKFY